MIERHIGPGLERIRLLDRGHREDLRRDAECRDHGDAGPSRARAKRPSDPNQRHGDDAIAKEKKTRHAPSSEMLQHQKGVEHVRVVRSTLRVSALESLHTIPIDEVGEHAATPTFRGK